MTKRLKDTLLALPFVVALCCVALFWYQGRELRSLRKKNEGYRHFIDKVNASIYTTMPVLGRLSVPSDLQTVPLADKAGVVLASKQVNVRGLPSIYNGSIIEQGENYLLFFRYDEIDSRSPVDYYSYIGCVELDAHFQQTAKEFIKLDTGSPSSEDPRVFRSQGELYLVFNDQSPSRLNKRIIRIAKVNTQDMSLNFITDLDRNMALIEKNWSPFEYVDEQQQAGIYFEYYINPHQVLQLQDPQRNSLQPLPATHVPGFQSICWPKEWGGPKGGTPARRVGDQYLAFFHSNFNDLNDINWYVMGAYTFEAKPPFRLTGISYYPILFEGMFDSPPMVKANPRLRALYPSGFVVEKLEDGRELIHVSCGENDSTLQIVTIDKDALFKTLKRLK